MKDDNSKDVAFNGNVGRRSFVKAVGTGGVIALAGCTQNGGEAADPSNTEAPNNGTTGETPENNSNDDISVVNFTDSWVPEGNIAPVIHALDQGRFAENGISLQYSRGYGSSSTIQQVAEERTEIGFAGLTATASQIEQGLDVVWVAPLIPQPMSSIHVHPEYADEVNSLQDLEGLTGSYSPGDVAWLVAQSAFAQEGVDMQSIDMEGSDTFMSMLQEGSVDFAVGWSTNSMPLWYAEDSMEPKIMPLSDHVPAYGNGFVVKEDYLEDNRETVERFLEVVYESYLWVYQNEMTAIEGSIDTLLDYFEELTLGEDGSRSTHEAMLQIFMSVLLTDSVKNNGLGYLDEEPLDSTFEIINDSIVDDPLEPEEVVLTDDPLVEQGQFVPPTPDSHSDWLGTIQPGEFDNPYM